MIPVRPRPTGVCPAGTPAPPPPGPARRRGLETGRERPDISAVSAGPGRSAPAGHATDGRAMRDNSGSVPAAPRGRPLILQSEIMTSVDTPAKETLGFQAEVKQLLHLMIHSLYSNKEIFLRELVSNASDACDKLRFEAMSDPALEGAARDFRIRVAFDKVARTITVSDNGIGMSRDDVVLHLGTIARLSLIHI